MILLGAVIVDLDTAEFEDNPDRGPWSADRFCDFLRALRAVNKAKEFSMLVLCRWQDLGEYAEVAQGEHYGTVCPYIVHKRDEDTLPKPGQLLDAGVYGLVISYPHAKDVFSDMSSKPKKCHNIFKAKACSKFVMQKDGITKLCPQQLTESVYEPFLQRYVTPGSHVLVAGFGTGTAIFASLNRACNVTGIDCETNMFNHVCDMMTTWKGEEDDDDDDEEKTEAKCNDCGNACDSGEVTTCGTCQRVVCLKKCWDEQAGTCATCKLACNATQ